MSKWPRLSSGWALLVFALVIIVGVRFKNPHLTETELLINFWLEWLGAVLFIALGLLCVSGKFAE